MLNTKDRIDLDRRLDEIEHAVRQAVSLLDRVVERIEALESRGNGAPPARRGWPKGKSRKPLNAEA